jgi:hypothetical protein
MIFNPDGKNMIPEEQDSIDYLILNGGLELMGIDSSNGEFLYSFTPKIKEIMPELYEQHIQDTNNKILKLWEKGFLDIDLMENDPVVSITPKALDEKEISTLSDEDQWDLKEIKRLLKKQ